MKKIYKLLIVFMLCIVTTAYCQFEESKCTIYKIGDNTVTQEVEKSNIDLYINDAYEWSIEPTVLMYTADGRSSWIWDSEVDAYAKVGWSINPPVIIYSITEERMVLQEEVDDYIATGIWFKTRPINITMNIFQKTNIPPEELNKILIKGLSSYGSAFYEMEQKYNINSIFAISVAELESGNGTSYAFRTKNNAFGIGPGKYFSSVEAGIEYFGQLMNNSLYYGKSIDSVGSIYCVGGDWANKVKSLMRSNYSGIGY